MANLWPLLVFFKVDGQGVRGGTFSGCRFSLLLVVKMAMTKMLMVVKKETKTTFRTSEVNFCRKSRF